MNQATVIIASLGYLCLLFGVAYYAEYRQRQHRSLINNPYVYALSLAVYCTAWTFYGSVGQAATQGGSFLTVYIGPTIMAALFWPVLRKIIRICRTQRINSLADLVSTRYGKNFSLAVMVTVLCMLGIIPYIAIQLKAIAGSINMLTATPPRTGLSSILQDNTFYIAGVLALFIILFGTRSIDSSEKHEGLVAAVAFESVIKLVAFLAVGIFVTFGLYNGFGDIFSRAAEKESLRSLFVLEGTAAYTNWTALTFLSMLAVILLPRQFQMGVVENVQENHLKKAIWLFPLYLFLINLFVVPVALGGRLLLWESGVHADDYVLALPQQHGAGALTLLVYIGGFSAATSMIIVETIAISTMVSNHIATPLLLASRRFRERPLIRPLLSIRRISIVFIIALAYLYDKLVAQHFSLVSIGMISFAAVAQFAPAILGGIYWKQASKTGAIAGIGAGFVIWLYTAILPSLASAGMIDPDLIHQGPGGQSWLRPGALFGLEGLDPIAHCLFWSLLVNTALFVYVSLRTRQNAQEILQAEIFVDIFRHSASAENNVAWKGTAYLPDLSTLLGNFLGPERADKLLKNYAQRHQIPLDSKKADPRLVAFSEKLLSGVIGSASARIMVSSVTKEEELRIDEVLRILRESQQMIELNKELRRQSAELQKATDQLTRANEQLTNMDTVKEEFLYTVTHELRTPLTSIRAMAEIIHDHADMDEAQRQHFLGGIIRETERLSHLITQVLNLEKYESGRQQLNLGSVVLNQLIRDSIESVQPLADEKKIKLETRIPDTMFLVRCDAALIQQVMNNLLSNAIKFVEPGTGIVRVRVQTEDGELQVAVEDNGKGIAPELHQLIFDKFFQARNQTLKKPTGSGLGLAICRKIVEMHGGRIRVESEEDKGARFIFTLPNT